MGSDERVIDEYAERVVPQVHREWLKCRAHSVDYGFPEQSLFWHTTDAALKTIDLLRYFADNGFPDIALPDEAALCATFHDVDRTLGKREYDVTLGELADVRHSMGLDDYAPTLCNGDLLWVVRNHHFFRRQGHFDGVFGDDHLSALLYLTTLADALAVARNPREIASPLGTRDRATAPLLDSFTSHRFEFVYHQLNGVTGFVSNLMHGVMADFLAGAFPKERRMQLRPLAFFPNGTVYIAPKGTIGKFLDEVPAKTVLPRLAEAFYRRFKEIVEKTGQFVADEKGQPTPAPFAFLMDPPSLVDAALSRSRRGWGIIQRQRDRLQRIPLELQEEGLTTSRRKQLEAEQDKLQTSLRARVEKLSGQLAKLLGQHEELGQRYGTAVPQMDLAALKIASDNLAFIVRAAAAYGLGEQILALLAQEVGLPPQEVLTLTVKGSGGVNYQAILLALHMLRPPLPSPVEGAGISDFLAAGDAVQVAAVSPVERLTTIAALVRQYFQSQVGVKEQLQALVKHELLAPETLAEFGADARLEKALLDELAWVLGESLEINGKQFPVHRETPDSLCNFCGRRCRGIRLSAKITPVDAPTTYSGYNLAESTDDKPRRICALCFFENALRKAIFPNSGNGLTLFVFPEYSFTRHHANVFHRQVRDRFPKALELEQVEDQEEVPDALLAAIQWVLRARPDAATADALLPVLVLPLSGEATGKDWLSHSKRVLQLWDGLGLKYILTPDFYPEVEGVGDVRGAVELRGCHPILEKRLRRWMQALRPQPVRGLPATVLTIPEAAKVNWVMQTVATLATDARREVEFYGNTGSFGASILYGKGKEKAKKGKR